jgi:exonuclease III
MLRGQSSGPESPCTPLKLNGPAASGGPSTRTLAPRGLILRGRWWDVIVLSVHAPTGDKIHNVKDRLCKELEHVFDNFHKYHMKILLGDFNVKVSKEDIFKPLIGNEVLHKISNDNGVRVELYHIQTADCPKYNVPSL